MAITVTTIQPAMHGFIINATSADASGCEELLAAPAAGVSIIVEHITISNNSVGTLTVTIGAGETGGAVTTPVLGPISLLSGQSISWNFKRAGAVITAATSLVVDSSGAGAITVFAQGRYE